MNDERRQTIIKFVSLGVGLSSVLLLRFAGQSISRLLNRWRIVREARYLQDNLKLRLKTPLPTTTIISHHSEWDHVHQTLFRYSFIYCNRYVYGHNLYSFLCRDISRIPIIGFDCEWVNFHGKTKPVAMIQLASYRGVCALVRVCCLSTIPMTLKVGSSKKYLRTILNYEKEYLSWSRYF